MLPWHKKLKKQLTRSPKMHFLDGGVVCQLLGIRSPEELRRHPLRGAIFESWVASELRKQQHHLNHPSRLFHFRDHRGLEVDLVQDHPEQITLIEAKSGATVSSDAFKALERVSALLVASGERRPIQQQLVYGGQHTQRRSAGRTALPWSEISSLATRS